MVTRRRVVFAAAIGAAVLLVVAVLVLLPVILRGGLESRLPEMAGRAGPSADLHPHVFTGRMGIPRLRLSQKGSTAPAVEFERFDLRVAVNSLLGNNIRIRATILTAPTLHG